MKSCCQSWINLNSKTKLKFRAISRVDKEVLCEKKADQLRMEIGQAF
jgi:hypothetical protein